MTESTDPSALNIETEHSSDIDCFKPIPFQSLSEHYPKLNAFSSFVGWAIILLIMLVVDFAVDKISLHYLVLPGLLILSLISGVVGYFSAKACGYYQDEFDIYFKQGLWWKKQVALNYSRIQHIDISHGPLERRYQMATIKFFTAGGATSDLRISGLPNERAEKLRTDILRYAKENVITDELAQVAEDSIQAKQSSQLTNDEPKTLEPDLIDATTKIHSTKTDAKND